MGYQSGVDARMRRSKARFRNDQHITGLHGDIGADIPLVEQVLETHRDIRLFAIHPAHHLGAIPRGERGEPSNLYHDVEQRQAVPIRQCLWVRRLTDHPDLLSEGADEVGDDDVD